MQLYTFFYHQRGKKSSKNTSIQVRHAQKEGGRCVDGGLECVTLYLISVNQSKIHSWLHDVKALSC